MAPRVMVLLKIDFTTRNDMKKGYSCVRRLLFAGKVLFMYLIEELKMFVGRLLCVDDQREFKVVSDCSLMLRERDLCKKMWSLSLSSCCE